MTSIKARTSRNSAFLQSVLKANERLEAWIFFTALFAYFYSRELLIVPAINFDEVRAAGYTLKIFNGEWPVLGSNSYTMVFASYWAVPFFKLLGPGLLALRVSGIVAVYLGTLLVSVAFYRRGYKTASLIFPFWSCAWPALFINQRYGIEASTFHFLCLGGFLVGLSRPTNPGRLLLAASTIVGVLCHPFFLAPTVAALVVRLLNPFPLPEKENRVILGLLGFFLIYFARLIFFIPEKEKAILMVVSDLVLMGATLNHTRLNSQVKRLSKLGPAKWIPLVIPAALTLTALTFLLTYTSTPWSIGIATGLKPDLLLMMAEGILGLSVGYALWRHRERYQGPFEKNFQRWLLWLCLTTLICALILIQPSARCYEVEIILVVATVSWVVSLLPKRLAGLFTCAWIVIGLGHFHLDYLDPILSGKTENGNLRFLFVKGTTETYPSAQQFLKRVGVQNGKPVPPTSEPDLRYFLEWKPALDLIAPDL